jgi:hypothetical protein
MRQRRGLTGRPPLFLAFGAIFSTRFFASQNLATAGGGLTGSPPSFFSLSSDFFDSIFCIAKSGYGISRAILFRSEILPSGRGPCPRPRFGPSSFTGGHPFGTRILRRCRNLGAFWRPGNLGPRRTELSVIRFCDAKNRVEKIARKAEKRGGVCPLAPSQFINEPGGSNRSR